MKPTGHFLSLNNFNADDSCSFVLICFIEPGSCNKTQALIFFNTNADPNDSNLHECTRIR